MSYGPGSGSSRPTSASCSRSSGGGLDRSHHGPRTSNDLVSRLDDKLFALNEQAAALIFPKPAKSYLDDWSRYPTSAGCEVLSGRIGRTILGRHSRRREGAVPDRDATGTLIYGCRIPAQYDFHLGSPDGVWRRDLPGRAACGIPAAPLRDRQVACGLDLMLAQQAAGCRTPEGAITWPRA